jgi:anhydro-N-acetylmuramic acid kinase
MRTFTEHIACKLQYTLIKKELFITGGGAYNDFLIERINFITFDQNHPENKIQNLKPLFCFIGV